MKNRLGFVVGAITLALVATGIAWAIQDNDPATNVSLAENQQVTLPVDDAGVVILARGNGQLTIVSATPNAGYTAEVEVAVGREVEADFRGNGERVQFNAELEGGVVRVRIRTVDSPSDASSAPAANATSSTTGVTTSTTVATAGTVAANGTSSLNLGDGLSQQIQVANAGSVLLARNGSTLTVVSTQANAGWAAEVEVATGREVEGDFRSGNARVRFNFEFEDGVVRIRIESEGSTGSPTNTTAATNATATTSTTGTSTTVPAAIGPITYNLDGAGTVTVVFSNGLLTIASINPAAGWTIQSSEQHADEIEVTLTSGEQEVEIKVRHENGELRAEIDRRS